MPPEEKCSPVRVGVWIKVSISFRVGGQPDNASEENCPPPQVKDRVRVSFWGAGQFSSGAIVLEPKRRYI